MLKKYMSLMLVFSVLMGVLYTGSNTSEAARFDNSKSKITLRVGAVYTLRSSGIGSAAKWTSSDKSVATVKKGKVVAKGTGVTTIRAKQGNISKKCVVTVKSASGKKGSKYNPKTFPKTGSKSIGFKFYMERKKIGKFKIKISKFKYGSKAAAMAKAGNSSNPVPNNNQQYLYFRVTLSYISGSQTIKMRDVFNYNKNIFGAYGAKHLAPINWGYGFEAYENMGNMVISPGTSKTAGVAILVEKGFKPVTFRIRTGKSKYTWIKM
ncbi:MAG: Ig-like domain-containing protein [Eubacterium sp.]|nr:Ig-like domain-containing protein [Eubacterium sp.]